MIKINFVPYESIRDDFKRVFRALQSNSIVLIDAKLDAEEEAELIRDTMERFSDRFSGIELSSLDSPNQIGGFDKVKSSLAEFITGKKRGFTIIGPANVVRKIKKNPRELHLYM